MKSVVQQNGFVAIREDVLKVEEDGDGWETVCYNKKNKTPEKGSSSECTESCDILHDNGGGPKVKRLVTGSADLPLTVRRVKPKKSSGVMDEDSSLTVENGRNHSETVVDSVRIEKNVSSEEGKCTTAESVSPIILQESVEDKELSDLTDGYVKILGTWK